MAAKQLSPSDVASLYDTDFVEWSSRNADLLRSGKPQQADIQHIAEEIEDMGKERRHALHSQIRRLLTHLLKYQFQPSRRGKSWQLTVANARIKIRDLLKENPSLRPETEAMVTDAYPDAVKLAALETGLPGDTFPNSCPYTFDQIANEDFLPPDSR
jgi:hypothetical protein